MFQGRMSLKGCLTVHASKFPEDSGLELIFTSLTQKATLCLFQLHDFDLPILLPILFFHKNHFFHAYQFNRTDDSILIFRETLYCCKTILTSAELDYAEETDEFARNSIFVTFGKVEIELIDLFSMYTR